MYLHDRHRWHRAGIVLLLLLITLMAWASLVHGFMGPALVPGHHHVHGGLSEPWSLTAFGAAFWMWVVMMAAMMLPSVLPMLLAFTRIRQRHASRPWLYVGAAGFLFGYFLSWLIFSALASLAQCCLRESGLLSPMLVSRSAVLSSAVLVLAGLYQLTRWKAVCLGHCRSSDSLEQDCHGNGNAFASGMHHGVNCLGSCWALMVMMFAFGVMNLGWMVLITVFVTLEKVLPRNPERFSYATGFLLLATGAWLILPEGLGDHLDHLFDVGVRRGIDLLTLWSGFSGTS